MLFAVDEISHFQEYRSHSQRSGLRDVDDLDWMVGKFH